MQLLSQPTDDELIQLLKKDDRAAFTEIYKRYAESLAGFAGSKLYDLDDARDILHDLFTRLWEDRHQLTITGNLKSYLFSAIRYRIIDKIRRNVTRQEYDVLLQKLTDAYAPGIEQHLDAKELQQSVEKSLTQLPARTREIYQLSRNEHHSVAEIAQMLQLSEQTVKNQLTTALKHLRETLISVSIVALLTCWLQK